MVDIVVARVAAGSATASKGRGSAGSYRAPFWFQNRVIRSLSVLYLNILGPTYKTSLKLLKVFRLVFTRDISRQREIVRAFSTVVNLNLCLQVRPFISYFIL